MRATNYQRARAASFGDRSACEAFLNELAATERHTEAMPHCQQCTCASIEPARAERDASTQRLLAATLDVVQGLRTPCRLAKSGEYAVRKQHGSVGLDRVSTCAQHNPFGYTPHKPKGFD